MSSLRVRAAARVVGKFCRNVAHQRAGRLLTAWARLRLVLIRKHRKIAATNKISSTYRMYKSRKSYTTTLQSAIRLQCMCRRAVARERVRVLRDPYFDMSFKELDILHNEEVTRMETAVNDKDFKTAAEIEQSL